MDGIESRLENAKENYLQELEDIAMDVFEKHIKKYLDKNKIRMINGGAWGSIYYKKSHNGKDEIRIDREFFPEKIVNILTIIVGNDFLEDYMYCYTPEDY